MIGMQKYPLVRLSANMVFTLSHIFRGLRTLARDLFCQWQAANHMMAPVKSSTNVMPMKHAHNTDPLERSEATAPRLGPKRSCLYSSAGCRYSDRNTSFDKQWVC
jgi:hypothetical protein